MLCTLCRTSSQAQCYVSPALDLYGNHKHNKNNQLEVYSLFPLAFLLQNQKHLTSTEIMRLQLTFSNQAPLPENIDDGDCSRHILFRYHEKINTNKFLFIIL
jgi:hypothetical protein